MARRGRPRKVGQTRMDAAIDALIPMGFPKDLITNKVKDLLEVYDGEWQFIEESSYKVLIDLMLEEQEEECRKKTDGDSASASDDSSKAYYATEPSSSAHNDAEPSNAHDDAMPDGRDCAEPACSRRGLGYRSAECKKRKDATFTPHAGMRQQWKDISCIPPNRPQEDGQNGGSTGLAEAGVQGTLDQSRPRRKPCYGWIGSEDEEEDCVFFETAASSRKAMSWGIDCQKDCRSSLDVK